jgi:hypothetical protein
VGVVFGAGQFVHFNSPRRTSRRHFTFLTAASRPEPGNNVTTAQVRGMNGVATGTTEQRACLADGGGCRAGRGFYEFAEVW